MQIASSENIFNYTHWCNNEVTVTNSLSEQIKTLRKTRGWTQLLLAEKLGVEQSTVSRWESGQSRPVGVYLMFVERLLAGKRVRK